MSKKNNKPEQSTDHYIEQYSFTDDKMQRQLKAAKRAKKSSKKQKRYNKV